MTPIGTVVHLQIQTSSLKKGVRPLRVYDPSPLLPVPRLRLAPEGAVGLAEDGSEHPDVHHAAHPHTKRARGREVSFGFTSHYRSMRERYGEKRALRFPSASHGRPMEHGVDHHAQPDACQTDTTGTFHLKCDGRGWPP